MTDAPKTDPGDLIERYSPEMIYYPETGAAEFVTSDAPHLYERVGHYVDIVRDITTREIVGFRIEDPKAWAAYVVRT